ncbi:NAD-dependent epimerase/dehydratase [Vibrio penaeicida]|uniref:NAD-dependent epimerase/dehydratase n=1 Tax=Vibrio penaeicida TaxID=104609 RepID=UPI000CEA5293|nr:NAD-dependent epimerase/dehydratase [Vibrio penaeicida]
MVIFITGASGYLGSQLVNKLSKTHKCVSLVRKSSSHARLENINTDLVYIDETGSLEHAFNKYRPDIVINTIALYGRNNESLSDLIRANVLVPSDLYALSNNYGCKAFLHTGTSLPSDVSTYAATKNTFVELIRPLHISKMKFINIALEHFYGPEDDNSKFTTYVINSCSNNSDLNLTNGLQQRDFIFIDDVVSAYQTLMGNLAKLHDFETIPLGSGIAPTVREFVETVHEVSQSQSALNFGVIPMRDKELMYSCANTTRLNGLGWLAAYSLERGIKKVIGSHSNVKHVSL